jgi:8-oxo-dGTP pyrophosphatase MutT (NUDIX family)
VSASERARDHASAIEAQARGGREGAKPVLAATVILLRDGEGGLETLMLKRNSKIAFGGMWVFPGGRIDEADWAGLPRAERVDASGALDALEALDALAAARRAARREAMEECGLEVDEGGMHPFSHWTPPPTTPRRFLTWFFAARATAHEVAIDHGEIHASAWMRPADALARRDAGEIEVAPPTFVSLSELRAFDHVEHALEAIRARTPERFQTRIGLTDDGPVCLWHGDAGYDASDPRLPGPRHRLTMPKRSSWTYDRTR